MANRLSAIPRSHEAGRLSGATLLGASSWVSSPILLKTNLPSSEKSLWGLAADASYYSIAARHFQRNACVVLELTSRKTCRDSTHAIATMYHGNMHSLAESVSSFISKEALLKPGDRVGLAVSGGADSVALFRLMMELRQELGILLIVLHFNHKLRTSDSESDEMFVRELSRRHDLEFLRAQGDVIACAAEKHLSLEAAARYLRYDFFDDVSRSARLNCIATAHTLDDQAETVLLKLARGSGTRGLAGIYPKLPARNPGNEFSDPETFVIRPLLGIRRREVESYLASLGQSWREDKSNRDLRHSRNVVRHGILPRLERNLNPAVREALAETAEIARAEEEYWDAKVSEIMRGMLKPAATLPEKETAAVLGTRMLSSHPLAVQRRLLRSTAESLGFKLDFKHVEQVLNLVKDKNRNSSTSLPGGWQAARSGDEILFCPPTPPSADYEYKLSVPGRIAVPEAGRFVEAVLIQPSPQAGYNPDQAIDPAFLGDGLLVRNWRPGDRFWPAHSRAPKKIKELLQERHMTGAKRKLEPVIVSRGTVIWMEGFPSPITLRPRDTAQEVMIIKVTSE